MLPLVEGSQSAASLSQHPDEAASEAPNWSRPASSYGVLAVRDAYHAMDGD